MSSNPAFGESIEGKYQNVKLILGKYGTRASLPRIGLSIEVPDEYSIQLEINKYVPLILEGEIESTAEALYREINSVVSRQGHTLDEGVITTIAEMLRTYKHSLEMG
jgi:hypothetical protein